MGNPKVSIGLPVYNGENFLQDAIDAVLAQTYPDFELIISDNASTDATEQIAREAAAADPRVLYSREDKNLGLASNYNRVFELASGTYFKWAAHDDSIAEDFLEKCVRELDAHPEVVLCQSLVRVEDCSGQLIYEYDHSAWGSGHPRRNRRLFGRLRSKYCLEDYGLIRASALRKTMPYGNFLGADRALLVDLALQGPFAILREPLFFVRQHEGRSVLMSRRQLIKWHSSGVEPSDAQKVPSWTLLGKYIRLIQRRVYSSRRRMISYVVLAMGVASSKLIALLGLESITFMAICIERARLKLKLAFGNNLPNGQK